MSGNPYNSQPETAFWSTAVRHPLSDSGRICIEPIMTSADNTATVCSAGSCFAQYIGKELLDRGLAYVKSDYSGERAESFGLGNVYTTRQLRQWLEFASGIRVWTRDNCCRDADGYRDLLLPQHEALATVEMLEERREEIGRELRKHLEISSLFIFTLGLTEYWKNTATEVLPVCPGTVAGEYDPANHHHMNLSYSDVVEDLKEIETIIREFNPDIRMILTVSPVPLTATATDQHVLVANARSKATLRAAVDEFTGRSEISSYFPSYELMTFNATGDARFQENLRNVSAQGVAFVMQHAFGGQDNVDEAGQTGLIDSPSGYELEEQAEVLCEEQMLDACRRLKSVTQTRSELFVIGDSHCGKIVDALDFVGFPVAGGMVMNGSGFSDNKFELSKAKIFSPNETPEAAALWDAIHDQLSDGKAGKAIYTNIGFQTHRTIAKMATHFGTPVLTADLVREYFSENFGGQLNILRELAKIGSVTLVEDPNLYSFMSGARDDTLICCNYNFDIYCGFLKNFASENGMDYFKPGEEILLDIFRETKGVAQAFSSDRFHGSDLYYSKLATLIQARVGRSDASPVQTRKAG